MLDLCSNFETKPKPMKRILITFEMIWKMKHLSMLVIICIIGMNSSLTGQNKIVSTYQNPVIPGDFPDPSVIRVGNMY